MATPMRGIGSVVVLKTPYGKFCSEKSESTGIGTQEVILTIC